MAATFIPLVTRSPTDLDEFLVLQRVSSQSTSSTALGNSGSFRYDIDGSGLKSTQQLNINWSQFANHTFFNSAQVKLDVAFNKIVDGFPFDGTQQEVELFFDRLTGWEKHVYDRFPKNKGYLFFSGSSATSPATAGTFVTVKDSVGAAFPSITRRPDGRSVLSPGSSTSMMFEFWLYVPSGSTATDQVVFQKLNTTNSHGFSCLLRSTGSASSIKLDFQVQSGSAYTLSSSSTIEKAKWNHITAIWDRTPNQHKWFVYANHELNTTSSQLEIGSLNFNHSDFVVGSGSGGLTSLSGAIDEFRVWHGANTVAERKQNATKTIYAQNGLVLYFKFNEPSGSNSNIVLDHSGNGLHGTLSADGFSTIKVRNITTSSVAGSSPMTYEKLAENPVLFPDHIKLQQLKAELFASASNYDQSNPSLITKLIPKHYILEGRQNAAYSQQDEHSVAFSSGSEVGSSVADETHVLLSMLYLWATFFDEIKLFTDGFSTLRTVNYNSEDTVPDRFLQTLAKHHGISLPTMFAGSSIDQYVAGNNLGLSVSTSDFGLQYIQNQIWRRILINLRDVLNSKGTLHSVKSFIRATGIDPDNNFRIREYGGPTKRTLAVSREKRSENSTMLSFLSGGYIESAYLSGSRTEPGVPLSSGFSRDGLFTSGSWTVEGTYKFKREVQSTTQSLSRLFNSSSSNEHWILANLLAFSGSGVTLFVKPTDTVGPTVLSVSLNGFDPMDGQVWNFSYGRSRGDNYGTVSSSYFLRAARSSFGDITEEYTTASWLDDNNPDGENRFQTIKSDFNPSGSKLVVGSSLTAYIPTSGGFLNSVSTLARTTRFSGSVAQLRFWSKELLIDEWREHSRNFKSVGVKNPKTNFNFVTTESGSFERLRLDVSTDQPITSSTDQGKVVLFDFSQNNLHMSGAGFIPTSSVILPQRFYYSYPSPRFDEASTTNKVRIRSLLSPSGSEASESSYIVSAPLYELDKRNEPTDDNRFSIEFSVVDALNQDIMNLFSTLDEFDNAIGDPTLLFAPDYPTLEVLRNVYFNRLVGKLNLKGFFEFYKWFDTNLGGFIAQLLPMKTRFKGTSFVIESHVLERSKFEYHHEDIYLGPNSRNPQKDDIRLQLAIGSIRKI